jgi:PTS system nitrogen regulatory IIA component
MRSLLDALQDGRLVELPGGDKSQALELLALIIEAIPDIGAKTDLVKEVAEREAASNTGLGRGVACPHCRVALDGELLCAVGWSPRGIEYGAPDGKPVHLLVMYYVPDVQRNLYLKEVSNLARAISVDDSIQAIASLPDIQTVREKLLDWVALSIGGPQQDIKARMIKLGTRQAQAAAIPPPNELLAADARILPFRLISWPDGQLVLCADPDLAETLEKAASLGGMMAASREFDVAGFRVAILSETAFTHDRKEYEAVAIQVKHA